MNAETSKNDGAGCSAPSFQSPLWNGAIVCVDAAEARLLRKAGHLCITSTKLRCQLYRMFVCAGEGAMPAAVDAVARLGGVSAADCPDQWSLWVQLEKMGINPLPLRQALEELPIIPTPFRDPKDVLEMHSLLLWSCTGTTVLVGRNTSELVRVADTYAAADCYRPHGRMDDPFRPEPGRVCLISADELRLLRIEGVEDVQIVFTYETEDTTGPVVTPHTSHWPSPLRAMCADRPGLRVGVAPALVGPRYGEPFFLGLTRGMGYESDATTNPYCRAAQWFAVETNMRTVAVSYRVVIWAGGDDVRELVRYGGLSIFTDAANGKRRKVQLRSLGLIRSDLVAGVAVYDMTTNRATLEAWAAKRDFQKMRVSDRDHDRQRVRSKRRPQSHEGDIKENTVPLMGLRSPAKAVWKAAEKLRKLPVAEAFEDWGVTTVHLKDLREGGVYHLNSRLGVNKKTGQPTLDQKRCKIRSPRWAAGDAAGMLNWLKGQPQVIMAGLEPTGHVFAVVKVANGTEDQQREAVYRWCEDAGKRFPRSFGAPSWIEGSVGKDSDVHIGAIHHVNWKALSLETARFERYQTAGDYGKPLKLARRGCATLSERAKAYVEKVEGLDCEGERNTCLSSAILNIRSKFGREALTEVLPRLLEKSTLPSKEKNKMAIRMLHDRGAAARKEAP